ncbi:MAG TPA: D-aminoacyl-tRNA deacylase [Spirochaetota bacterium]|nr:D-aminoacyl-tRNA deacylase [Spirochaetota bacterium]HOS32468.1 D-aminoacyl-tRNA deacylase [Spirochaetota bacterium]HOS54805.1 D-aminoacyl-tRNA deacylase [Spirochaetota bacterium]HPK61499.1 D-aminoacyl-tRNA deacylase [Spirochaetota bacterium]HQF76760.1 D-aminoacyl-tRNA deacylase [Spirochaetota bacterium]
MRSVVQRVKTAGVSINNQVYSSINSGLLCLLGISPEDGEEDIKYMVDKITNLRIFQDDSDKMNKSLIDINGEILVVSQFTLYGDARKGRRPSFDKAANGESAKIIYEEFLTALESVIASHKIKTGVFAEMMEVNLINDGPVTILLDSKRGF